MSSETRDLISWLSKTNSALERARVHGELLKLASKLIEDEKMMFQGEVLQKANESRMLPICFR
jgi:hypothetical protein